MARGGGVPGAPRPNPGTMPARHLVPAVPVAPADPAVPAERREAPGDLGAVAVPVARVDPVEAAVRADPAVRPVVAVISVVAVVVRVDPAVAPVDPAVAPVGHRVVPVAAAVASVAPVVVATPLVRSASPVVVPRVAGKSKRAKRQEFDNMQAPTLGGVRLPRGDGARRAVTARCVVSPTSRRRSTPVPRIW
jgi:hypothetical protein